MDCNESIDDNSINDQASTSEDDLSEDTKAVIESYTTSCPKNSEVMYESEDDTEPEDQESNLHTDRSFTSEGDKSLNFSADQSKLEDSCSGPSSQHHDDDILRETKLHHEKEILSYKQNIDELQSKLNSKIEEAKELTLKNSELQKKYEQLEVEKNECINKMSEEFAAQKKCQLFLESGAIEEVNHLRLQVKRLEGENSLLKIEVNDLTSKNSELQKRHEQIQNEKNEWINKMSEEFAALKKCQLFLESGAIEEINHLRLRVKCLAEENSHFKIEVKDLTTRNSELQKKYEQIQNEKNEWINKMPEEFAALKKCQLFLESGAIGEINRLRLHVKRLEEEGSLLKESFLHRRIRSLISWLPFSNLLLN